MGDPHPPSVRFANPSVRGLLQSVTEKRRTSAERGRRSAVPRTTPRRRGSRLRGFAAKPANRGFAPFFRGSASSRHSVARARDPLPSAVALRSRASRKRRARKELRTLFRDDVLAPWPHGRTPLWNEGTYKCSPGGEPRPFTQPSGRGHRRSVAVPSNKLAPPIRQVLANVRRSPASQTAADAADKRDRPHCDSAGIGLRGRRPPRRPGSPGRE